MTFVLTVIQEDPHRTVQAFIDLIQRHEQSFYYFVHKVHSKGEGLFDSLMRWIEMFLTVVREGLGEPLSLEFLLPHTGKERTEILEEVDKVATYHYKLKVLYEDKLRRRFGSAQGYRDADAEDEATQALVNGVLGEIDFGELAGGDAQDIAAEETDDSSDGYSSDEYLTSEETSSSEADSTGSTGSEGSTEDSRPSSSPPSPHSEPASHPHAHPQPRLHAKKASATTSPRAPRNPAAVASTASGASTPPLPRRKRSLSLGRMRSLTSLGSRKPNDETVPPVPPLPKTPRTAVPIVSASSSSKPLPPNPLKPLDSNAGRELPPPPRRPTRTSQSSPGSGQQSQQHQPSPPKSNNKVDKKKKENVIKPPELVHIPQLLPVFVELVCFPLVSAEQRCLLTCSPQMRPALQIRKMSQK